MSESFMLVDSKGNATEIKGETKIGRSKTSELVLTDPLASRHHATVYMEGDTLMIRDEQSVNGTIVNRSQIFEPTALKDRDSIQFGDEVYTVRAPLAEAQTIRKPMPGAEVTAAKKGQDSTQPKIPVDEPVQAVEDELAAMTEPPQEKNTKRILLIVGALLVILCVCCVVSGVIYQQVVGGLNLF